MSDFHFNKFCDPADFADPAIQKLMRDELNLPHDFVTQQSRKNWEWAVGLRALKDYGYLQPNYRALGLGAGHEAVLFALTNHIQLVVATDIYGEGKFSGGEGTASMLRDPAKLCDFPYKKDRLLALKMDACNLGFGDNSFDILFSFSSIEHFGNAGRIRSCIQEAYRVLRPGGIFVVALDTIYREPSIKLPRPLRPGKAGEFFTSQDIQNLVLNAAPFKLRQPLNMAVDPKHETNIYDALRHRPAGTDIHPHIHLEFLGWYFSSFMMILFKDDTNQKDSVHH